jgi:hypothetical protein
MSIGQYPDRNVTGVYTSGGSILALGDHPTLSARIRIPTTTQVNRTNVAKRLYFAPAPGIYLNGTPLDSLSSPIILPDSGGNKEYIMTADPSAAGQTARFWLGDDTGKTNTSAVSVSVPKITKVELTVSQNPYSVLTARTDLVPEVKGVIRARHFDSRFEMPRITLNPAIAYPTLTTGSIPLGNTDFILAKASGATDGTWTLNNYRWDSARSFRHGIPLERGTTRIDVGIDFNFDGELSEDEIFVSCDVITVDDVLIPDYDYSNAISNQEIEWRKDGTNAVYLVHRANPYRVQLRFPELKNAPGVRELTLDGPADAFTLDTTKGIMSPGNTVPAPLPDSSGYVNMNLRCPRPGEGAITFTHDSHMGAAIGKGYTYEETLPFTAVQVDAESIYDADHNPSVLVQGDEATFAIKMPSANIPDGDIVWTNSNNNVSCVLCVLCV